MNISMNCMLKPGAKIPMKNSFPTILDVIPRPLFTNAKECMQFVEEAHQYFTSRDKDMATAEEVSFLICINRYIAYFERAKSMLAKNRFTVKYRGGKRMQDPDIFDYEIISLSDEDRKGL